MAAPDPEAHTHAFIDRLETLLEEVHTLGRQLERPRPNESASAEAGRVLYFTLASANRGWARPNDGGCAEGLASRESAAWADGRRLVGAAGAGAQTN